MKRLMGKCLVGFLCGVAIDYLVALVASYVLKMGYFMPCLSTMPEIFGGELRAICLQAVAFGLPGAAVGAAIWLGQRDTPSKAARVALALCILLASLIPFALMAVRLLANAPY